MELEGVVSTLALHFEATFRLGLLLICFLELAVFGAAVLLGLPLFDCDVLGAAARIGPHFPLVVASVVVFAGDALVVVYVILLLVVDHALTRRTVHRLVQNFQFTLILNLLLSDRQLKQFIQFRCDASMPFAGF